MRRPTRNRVRRPPPRAARLLVITGSMGAGKTTMMAEASDLLKDAGVAHAAIDLDALGIVHLATLSPVDLAYRNLEAVWRNVAAAGIDALLVAAAIETRADLDRLRAVVGAGTAVVCRLRAPLALMEDRVRVREPGLLQPQLVARVSILDAVLDAAALEDFSLVNDGTRPITAVAREMLVRAGWTDGKANRGDR